MITARLRFDEVDVVCQEVPDEISLVLNITECPHHCVGCHSPHLSESYGEYVEQKLPELMKKYACLISCVCFMGGDQHVDDLYRQCKYIRDSFPEIKIAVYTGADSMEAIGPSINLIEYIKIGRYIDELGGLDKQTTNQKMYKKESGEWHDITYRFRKEGKGRNT